MPPLKNTPTGTSATILSLQLSAIKASVLSIIHSSLLFDIDGFVLISFTSQYAHFLIEPLASISRKWPGSSLCAYLYIEKGERI